MASAADRKRVYVQFRAIFSGKNAELRKKKAIKRLIGENPTLNPPQTGLDGPQVVEILRSLLEARIFESEERAKVEFPDLFRPSPSRDARREALEVEAERFAARALCEAASQENSSEDDAPPDELLAAAEELLAQRQFEIEPNRITAKTETTPERRLSQDKIPSLFPTYLPYNAQHVLLNTAQQILEECCFDFATAHLPSVFCTNPRWECPSAVELTKWVYLFRTKFPLWNLWALSDAERISAEDAKDLLHAMSSLRHTAVHRLPTTARGTSHLLASAVHLACVLRDTTRAAQLDELQAEVDGKTEAMELNKNVLEEALAREMRDIQRRREELDRLEVELVQDMVRDDAYNRAFVGRLLEESARAIFTKGKGKAHAPDEDGGSCYPSGREDSGGEQNEEDEEEDEKDEKEEEKKTEEEEKKMGDEDEKDEKDEDKKKDEEDFVDVAGRAEHPIQSIEEKEDQITGREKEDDPGPVITEEEDPFPPLSEEEDEQEEEEGEVEEEEREESPIEIVDEETDPTCSGGEASDDAPDPPPEMTGFSSPTTYSSDVDGVSSQGQPPDTDGIWGHWLEGLNG